MYRLDLLLWQQQNAFDPIVIIIELSYRIVYRDNFDLSYRLSIGNSIWHIVTALICTTHVLPTLFGRVVFAACCSSQVQPMLSCGVCLSVTFVYSIEMNKLFSNVCHYLVGPLFDLPRQQWSLLNVFAQNRDTAVPAEGNGDFQTLICVLVARPRRCLTLSNPVP